MQTKAQTIAIIPARGGSKRIPRKNIRLFRGKPIIAWSIETALASDLFGTVMVSTDDDEIAAIAEKAGAVVPFRRTKATADDHATTADVLLEVLARYQLEGVNFQHACCLYPTSPLTRSTDLVHGYNHLVLSGFDVVMPVAAYSYPIWRSLSLDKNNGRLALNFPEHLTARSQDLPASYHDAGQWYWFKTSPFYQTRSLLGANSGSIVLPSMRVQDIDNEEDWIIAELKHEKLNGF